jgi:hypothetical protein
MKTPFWITTASLIAIGAGAFALTSAQQPKQDKPVNKPTEAGASKDDMSWMMPGDEHKVFNGMVGKWTFKMKMNGPQGPTEEAGTSEMKMALGGRFIEDSTHSQMMGQPFEGHGYTGFDRIKNKYVGTWMDTMCTCILTMEGTYDAGSKTFTFMMDMPDGMNKTFVKEKLVQKWTDNDHFTSTFTKVGSDGKGPSDFSIEYTRAK